MNVIIECLFIRILYIIDIIQITTQRVKFHIQFYILERVNNRTHNTDSVFYYGSSSIKKILWDRERCIYESKEKEK